MSLTTSFVAFVTIFTTSHEYHAENGVHLFHKHNAIHVQVVGVQND
jgi:hypothetical protein